MENYSINDRNKVKRVPERGHYDQDTIYKILDEGFLAYISFVVGDQPMIIPTLYGREGNKLYIHGASTSRMIKNLEKGVPVSLCVCHVDGLVLARSAFHHSMNYRSAVVFGKATMVDDRDKEHALFVISEHLIKDRWSEVRKPNAKELKATTVLALDIEQASAKIRSGAPKDDREDYQLDIWAGVIPTQFIAGQPITDEVPGLDIEVSDSVTDYVDIHRVNI